MPVAVTNMTEKEKAKLIADINANTYERRPGGWNFRNNMGPRDFLLRMLCMIALWFYAELAMPACPRGREDARWVRDFSIVVILFFIGIHALAYMPTATFGSCSQMWGAVFRGSRHAYRNWNDY